jgi:hypothetical protein
MAAFVPLPLPLAVAADTLRNRGHDVELPPGDTGPYSLGSEAVVHDTLAGTGWADPAWTRRSIGASEPFTRSDPAVTRTWSSALSPSIWVRRGCGYCR